MFTTRHRFIVLLHFLLFVMSLSTVTCRGQEKVSNINDVVSGIKQFCDLFTNQPCWLVRYTESRKAFALPPGFSNKQPQSEYVNAQKGDLLYAYQKKDTSPPSEIWVAWRDGVSTHRTLDTYYEIFPDVHPELFSFWGYTHNLFIDTHKNQNFKNKPIAASFGSSSLSEALWFALPRSIERKLSEWELKPNTQQVDGFSCVVLQRTVDKIARDTLWIDAKHGFVCRKRIYKDDSDKPVMEWKNEKLVEKSPGLWLPMRQIVKFYNSKNSPREIRGKLRYVRTIDVKEISFSNRPDSFFTAPLIKEGMVSDYVRSLSYTVHSGNAKPEESVQQAVGDAVQFSRTAKFEESPNRTRFLVFNIIFILVILLLMQWRKRMKLSQT